MARFGPVLVLGARTAVGLLLSLALGTIGVGAGWISFVFFGATAHTTLLVLFIGGAGLGVAGGVLLAWIQLDHNRLPRLLSTGAVLFLAGLTGGWGGLRFGSQQEVPCCAGPEITPMTYIVLGAVVLSNAVALLLGVVQTFWPAKTHRRPAWQQEQFRR